MTTNTNNPTGKYTTVNGINLYYEIHGTGKPLIMLHGGFGTFEMFSAFSPVLAQNHQVIGVDRFDVSSNGFHPARRRQQSIASLPSQDGRIVFIGDVGIAVHPV